MYDDDDAIVQAHLRRQPERARYYNDADYWRDLQVWRGKLMRALQASGRKPILRHGERLSSDSGGWSGR